MISLFLDSSSHQIVVGIYRDLEQIYLNIEKNDNQLSERLLPMIHAAFDAVSMKINQIDRIYIVNGPGSFTGIRIGVTIAKTIAWALKKEIIPISELELMASTHTETMKNIALIDARRNYVYAGIYDDKLNVIQKNSYRLLDELLKEKDATFISMDTFDFETTFPKYDIPKLIAKHQNDKPMNPHEVKPNYLKRTEAEENYDSRSNQE